jgi:iron complex outermembrane receptor protein
MRLLIVLIALFSTLILHAGTPEPLVIDTIHLEGVTLVSDYRKFQPGAKIDRLSSEQLQLMPEASLEQALMRLSPIYIKGNAGGLSTIRFRGTSANHTAIKLGGLNINSLTLGHANASNIPTYLFDGINLQYGGSSAINGSGSIGGTVYLEQQSKWTKGQKANLSTTTGSFGEQFYGTKIYVGNGRWESVTKAYWFQKENDFYFNNPFNANYYTNPQPVREKQSGAAIENKGVLQQVNYRFNSAANIQSTFWYEDSWHEVQPNMQSNNQPTPDLHNKSFRSWLELDNRQNPVGYKLGAGYVHDEQLYNKNEAQLIVTDRLVTEASAGYQPASNQEIKAGVLYKHIVPEVYAYSKAVIDYEQQLDLYLSYYFQPVERLEATVNVRQMLVTDFEAPFTPALVMEYQVVKRPEQQLALTGGFSRSFRIPTFNDRYWGVQGNPNLKAEDGLNAEGGFLYLYQKTQNHYKAKVNIFYMDVDNWIQWSPGSIDWEAQNIDRVKSKGVEVQLQAHISANPLETEWGVNYSFNPVNDESQNKQLIYAPKHTGNAFGNLQWGEGGLGFEGIYTGERLHNKVGDTQPSHFITNLSAWYRFKFGQQSMRLTAQVLNLLNEDYQNEAFYAMPGSSYKLSISIDINNLK